MAESKLNRLKSLLIIFLVAVIIIGGIIAWSRYIPEKPIEISLSKKTEQQGRIFIGGAVNNPGYYPFSTGDTLEGLVQKVGGVTEDADLSGLELCVSSAQEGKKTQKVNINLAEKWLLEALPGIGENLAQRVIDYRQQNGLFLNTNELLNVSGIGAARYEGIKHLITVSD